MKRVVVTGVGVVSPLGSNIESSWRNLIDGKSGIKLIPDSLVDTSQLPSKVCGFIPDSELSNDSLGFCIASYVPQKEAKRMDRFIHLGIAASVQAIKDSGWLPEDELAKFRTGILVGSGIGGLTTIEQNALILSNQGAKKISPFFVPASLINLIPGHVAIKYGFKGPNYSVVSACATGAHSIADGARIISSGDADVMVCGGAEAPISPLGIAGFAAARALSTGFNDFPEKASRPWDKSRDGFVIAEGAGVVVLEELSHAINRGAKIYAELIGYGATGDAYHITAPEPWGDGGYRAMQIALDKAGISAGELDYINAHGTSTPIGDMVELQAIDRLFTGIDKSRVSISSTKSSTGHTLGAAGGIEAIFSMLAIGNSVVPPTLNLDDPEESYGFSLVPHSAKRRDVRMVLSNSFGFGGANVSLLFRKFDG